MKTHASTQQETQAASAPSQTVQGRAASVADARPESAAQLQRQHMAGSSAQAVQLKRQADMMAGASRDGTVQRVGEEEEPAQRKGEDELEGAQLKSMDD